ncbi:MAG: hypothetical protein M5U34_33480 [Chloroflexi bacterium]|nr:hypothetical protein [Chloroflexota bacterium]
MNRFSLWPVYCTDFGESLRVVKRPFPTLLILPKRKIDKTAVSC